jgi:hypothetical protein
MKTGRRFIVGVLACLAASTLAATTQYKYSQAGNFPGAFRTFPLAVNGKYIGGYYESGNLVNGYLQRGTAFQNMYPPGSKSSYVGGLNRNQAAVG